MSRLMARLRGAASPIPPDPRAYLSSEARGKIESVIKPGLSVRWEGAPTSGWADDVTVTSAASLTAAIASASVSQHTRIRVSTGGDWSSTATIEIKNKDYKGNGGSLLIEPLPGSEPVLMVLISVVGSRNIHLKNLKIGNIVKAGITTGATLRPVIRIEGCEIGHYVAGLDVLANFPAQGILCSECDEVQVFNSSVRRTGSPLQFDAIRRLFCYDNLVAEWSVDQLRLTGADGDWGGGTIATQYPGDPNMYFWIARNVFCHSNDDPSLSAAHADSIDFADVTDNVGYRGLVEYNVTYGQRVNSISGGVASVVAGYQFNNGLPDLGCVEHSNFWIYGGYDTLIVGEGEFYSERSTYGRVADLPGAVDYYARIKVENLDGLTFTSTDCIFAASLEDTPGVGNVTFTGSVIADPRKTAATDTKFSDVFAATNWTTDGEARTTYPFTDDGSLTKEEVRAAVWAQFEPKAEYAGKGPPDPATWPTTL